MAAYAALASLSNMIHRLQQHPFPPISLDEQQVESLTKNVAFLEEFLEGYKGYSDEANHLESRIADAARAAEAAIESYIAHVIMLNGKIDRGEEIVSDEEISCVIENDSSSDAKIDRREEIVSDEETILRDQIDYGEEISSGNEIDSGEEIDYGEDLSCDNEIDSGEEIVSDEEINCINFYQDLQQLVAEMDLIKLEVMGIVEENSGVQNQLQRNALTPFDVEQKSMMVGFDDVLLEVLDKLTARRLDRRVIPIVGMGGIGKTTLARNIYAHPLIKEHFDICAWVTVSLQYNTKDILCQVLSQAKKESKERLISEMCEDGIPR